MKTAEEWVTETRNKLHAEQPARIKAEIHVLATHKLIKQIQVDALIEALKLVNEQKETYSYSDCGNDSELHAQRDGEITMWNKIQKAILSARDNLKEI